MLTLLATLKALVCGKPEVETYSCVVLTKGGAGEVRRLWARSAKDARRKLLGQHDVERVLSVGL